MFLFNLYIDLFQQIKQNKKITCHIKEELEFNFFWVYAWVNLIQY